MSFITDPEKGPTGVIADIVACVGDCLGEASQRVEALGIGVAGQVDAASGTVHFAPNLGWRGMPLRAEVEQARSGHPGLPLGAAPMAYVLWDRFLRHSPRKPAWFNRDRFILSAGHGSALLYALLHITGYDLPLEELKRFRQWGSKTPGHPEYGHTPGIEATTGPLGQGFAMGVGMAMAEHFLACHFNRPGFPLVDTTLTPSSRMAT